MVKTVDGVGGGWKPTTIYRLAYRKPSLSSSSTGGEDKLNGCSHSQSPPPSPAVARFDRLLADRNVIENAVAPEIAIPLRTEVTLSTYGRDFLLPSRMAAVAKWSSRPPESTGGHGSPTTAGMTATACEQPAVAPRTNVTYSGPKPPEPYFAPRTEYWWTHGQLGGRVIADGGLPKRTKRCQRINPTRIF